MESGRVFIKELHKEFYRLLKQKSTLFITLCEIKTHDFTISKYCTIARAQKRYGLRPIDSDDDEQPIDSIVSDDHLICRIYAYRNYYRITDIFPDDHDDNTLEPTDLIFAIPKSDFGRFVLAYLKTHTFISSVDILNFLIPYTDYYDYSKFDDFSYYMIRDDDQWIPKNADFIKFVLHSREILNIYLNMIEYINSTLTPEESDRIREIFDL